jgi:acid stress chaperone HdeB
MCIKFEAGFSFRLRPLPGKRAGAAIRNLFMLRTHLATEMIMKTSAALLATVGLLALAAPANAVVLDLSTLTCKQFIEGDADSIKMVLTWLDGWYKGDSDEAIIDTDVFVANAKKFGEFCAKNPTLSVVTAAEKILGD